MNKESYYEKSVWVLAVGQALNARNTPGLAWKRNELCRGIDLIGEHYAIPHLAHLMGSCSTQQQKDALVRAAAITAINHNCPQKDHRDQNGDAELKYRLGHSLRQLTFTNTGKIPSVDPAKKDSVGRRLALLPEMDFDSAVDTISALVSFANSKRVSVNFFDLAKTLYFWGNGLTDASMRTRNRVLSDYYGAAETPRKAI